MAKSSNGKINRSQEIRDVLTENAHAKPSEVVAELAKKGIKVSSGLVYLIKSKANQKKRRKKREAAVEVSKTMGTGDPVKLILKVRGLAQEAGGIRYLKQLVDVLAE